MPVVLDDSHFDDWMRGSPDQAAALMKPYAGTIETWEVSAEVGNVKNNRPEHRLRPFIYDCPHETTLQHRLQGAIVSHLRK